MANRCILSKSSQSYLIVFPAVEENWESLSEGRMQECVYKFDSFFSKRPRTVYKHNIYEYFMIFNNIYHRSRRFSRNLPKDILGPD